MPLTPSECKLSSQSAELVAPVSANENAPFKFGAAFPAAAAAPL